jgi:hypothetical protein
MEMPKASEADGAVLEKGNVRFSAEELAELDRKRAVIRVPRDRCREIAWRYGSRAARPWVQSALGIACLVGGFYLLVRLLMEWWRGGGVLWIEQVAGLVVLGFVGGALMVDVLRKGHYLEVRTEKATEKLRFDRSVAAADIETFLAEAGRRWGYAIVDRRN